LTIEVETKAGFARTLAGQLAMPRGTVGRVLGSFMDIANQKPTRLAVDLLAPKDGEHILDAGCGTGAAMAQVLDRANCQISGIDPSATMIAAARRRLQKRASLYQTGIMGLSLPAASIDAVLLLNVLYFCDIEGHMVNKLRQTLKPGGRLVIYVTHRDSMEKWPFAQQGLHRLFDESQLFNALIAGGFAPDRIDVYQRPITRSVGGLLALAKR
jgi:ubiquinone/menaquinone biosynthesis C-methylase UbiE